LNDRSSGSTSAVLYERVERIAYITLNRPEKLNAIDDDLFRRLFAALETAREDTEVRTVVIRGAGRAFSVGQDLGGQGATEILPADPRTRPFEADLIQAELWRRERWEMLYRFPKNTIAAVHGYCLGAGCDIALLCHTLIAADDAVFGDPSIRLGYAPWNPLWTWRVGLRKAKELLLTGRYVDAQEAARLGLATYVVPRASLEAEVVTGAEVMARQQGIAGLDGVAIGYGAQPIGAMGRRGIVNDVQGLAAAWDFSSYCYFLSSIQRRGFEPGDFNFFEARDRLGTKQAIDERDRPYRELFEQPRPRP
jgi:enoyl-CoA hydratase